MNQLIFRVKKADSSGRSKIELVLNNQKILANDTDEVLLTLDKLLKKNKIELEAVKSIKMEIDKKAGLTSQRIIKSIVKALSLNL